MMEYMKAIGIFTEAEININYDNTKNLANCNNENSIRCAEMIKILTAIK